MLPLADSRDGTVYLVLDSLRVVAFNTADGWMCDVTADIARELRFRGARGRVESSPEPTPMATLSYVRHLQRQVRRRDAVKGTARPHARPGDEPCLVRHGTSVA